MTVSAKGGAYRFTIDATTTCSAAFERPDPGDGYLLLKRGELLQPGDEYLTLDGSGWEESIDAIQRPGQPPAAGRMLVVVSVSPRTNSVPQSVQVSPCDGGNAAGAGVTRRRCAGQAHTRCVPHAAALRMGR